jgi:WbqC-like protein family
VRVGVIQSSYIPWRGYFDFIASVDIFVFHDDIQYTKGDWRNRNKIKTPHGAEWITVPVAYKKVAQLICETPIDSTTPWRNKHLRTLEANYRQAPFFYVVEEFISRVSVSEQSTISQLNINLIRRISNYLEINTPMIISSELSLQGSKTERLIDLLKKLNATTYLSGPSADAYLDKDLFRQNGISLEYKSYDYAPYPQLWGDFIGGVTVLDLIANCGSQAKEYILSRTPNKLIVA